jgi:hypothetical protein
MTSRQLIFSVVLLLVTPFRAFGEARCPGNVASLHFQVVNRHQIVLSVKINHTGPYNFLLDTGTEITILDSSLSAELNLKTTSGVAIAGYGFRESASYAQLDLLEAGSHGVTNLQVVVYDLRKLQSAGLQIRGLLGENFLEHFDLLIDNSRSQLCLDDSLAMREKVKGQRIPLVAPDSAPGESAIPKSLIVAAHFASGRRVVRLKLDSGSNAGFLYNASDYLALGLVQLTSVRGAGANGVQRSFQALPPQDLRVGSVVLSQVPFYAIAGTRKDSETTDFDGLLSLEFFRRVFIDRVGRFAILEQ